MILEMQKLLFTVGIFGTFVFARCLSLNGFSVCLFGLVFFIQ